MTDNLEAVDLKRGTKLLTRVVGSICFTLAFVLVAIFASLEVATAVTTGVLIVYVFLKVASTLADAAIARSRYLDYLERRHPYILTSLERDYPRHLKFWQFIGKIGQVKKGEDDGQ